MTTPPVPREPEPNSFALHVRDATGEEFAHVAGDLALMESSKAHARAWLRWRRRPRAYLDRDHQGKPLRSPVGKCRIVVETYYDPTAAQRGPR